jgi:hypothetical protein
MDKNGDLGFERRYHASGHASGEDITWAIEQIDPDYIRRPRIGFPIASRMWCWWKRVSNITYEPAI